MSKNNRYKKNTSSKSITKKPEINSFVKLNIDPLLTKYESEYSNLIPKNVSQIIETVNDYLSSFYISPKYKPTNDTIMSSIEFIKNIHTDLSKEKIRKSEHFLRQLYFLNKEEVDMINLFEENGCDSVENPQEYLSLIKKVTKEIGSIIVSDLEKTLPMTPIKEESENSDQSIAGVVSRSIKKMSISPFRDISNTPSSSSESPPPISSKRKRDPENTEESHKSNRRSLTNSPKSASAGSLQSLSSSKENSNTGHSF